MNIDFYNNIGIGVISIGSVLNHYEKLSIAKACLILPFISHQEMLRYLSRKTTKIKSIEKLIADKTSYFSNFNKRYYDALCLTFNSLQYLNDTGYIKFLDGNIFLRKPFEQNNKLGNRANKIFSASKNVAFLLNENTYNLYLNLRVEL
ncbi:MAG: hypothetical protein GF353_27230 [Candidatus Lokiarchaeota archaeon]|nr:hypothetical protein [Candidatus Lokiarchaeota archaeon]